ncbi:nucleolar protein 10-like [Sinocyclocheilus grahami]|uniref:nucleolar protein 10-like n=1 Tax=Sinocyclocheilus grahami TaxID=75366 RepID=UPI0007AC7420|nr:PREDICTED: nucleolar protein 10-like [Sinocyclocheilus grahami]
MGCSISPILFVAAFEVILIGAGKLVQKQLREGLEKIDSSQLPGKLKVWCYQFTLFQRVMWPLKVSEIPSSLVSRIDTISNTYIRKWLGLPRCFSDTGLFGKNALQLPLKSINLGYKQEKTRLVFELKESRDEAVKSAGVTVCTGPSRKPGEGRQKTGRTTCLLTPGKGWKTRVDLGTQLIFPTEITQTTLRPDVVVWATAAKKVLIIELTVPWEEGIPAAYEFKRLKYSDLVAECRDGGWTATILPVEVGCRGFVGKSAIQLLRAAGTTEVSLRRAIKELAEEAEKYLVYNRCYDTYQLSLKFERCLESDVVTFDILSEDSKLVFLHIDRYVEFHSQHGHYYKTRIPKFGRDFSYHYPSSDLYFVGASSEVFRLNLEQGRFLHSLLTDAAEINVCDINPVHQFFAAGTLEGRVDCWDPRVRSRVGVLDCALSSITNGTEVEGLPSVSALKFNGSLGMAVGTSTGQVLVYDLRSSRTLLVKDHYYGLPIKSLHFHNPLDLVLSADSKIIKMWNKDNGKVFSSIEPQANINDVCLYPGSGMLFTANEDPKMNTFYIPALGPAPRWCSFLENLTEELGENPESTIYDDYKFVTRKANLGKCLSA